MEKRRPGRRLAWSAAIFSVATGISRVLGLIREMVAGYYFGSRGPINAFTVAFQIPNLIRVLVADAALSGAFVPVFSELLEKGDRARAWRVASTLLWLLFLGLTAVTAVFILLAPVIMPPLTSGYDDLTVRLSQILFPLVVLLGVSGIIVGILNAYDEFAIPALTPVAWNLVIIAGLVIGVPQAETTDGELYVYAVSIVIGTVVQVLLPIPWLRGLDGRLRVALDWRDPAVWRVFKLMIPVTISLGLINLNAVIGTFVAAKYIDPTIAPNAIDKAFRIYMLPQGMFSVAVATVLFPALSRLSTRADWDGFRATVATRPAPDRVPARAGERHLRRPRRADRAPRLPARRVHARPDADRRERAGRLLPRARLQRGDVADEQSVLQPAGAAHPDARRRRQPDLQRRCSTSPSTGSASGACRWRSRSRTSQARSRSCSCCAGASADWSSVTCGERSLRITAASAVLGAVAYAVWWVLDDALGRGHRRPARLGRRRSHRRRPRLPRRLPAARGARDRHATLVAGAVPAPLRPWTNHASATSRSSRTSTTASRRSPIASSS